MKPAIDPQILLASALLGRSNRIIRSNAAGLIEAHSTLRRDTSGEFVPIPGTIDPDAIGLIAQLIEMLRDIEKFIGTPLELGPSWLDDIIARRGAWSGGVQ